MPNNNHAYRQAGPKQTTEIKIDDIYLRCGGHDKKYTVFEVPNSQILKWAMPLLYKIWNKNKHKGCLLHVSGVEDFLDYLKEKIK